MTLAIMETGDVGRRDRRTGRDTESGVRVAAERPLLPVVQGLLLRVPLGPRRTFARPLLRFHLRLPGVSGESTTFFSILWPIDPARLGPSARRHYRDRCHYFSSLLRWISRSTL